MLGKIKTCDLEKIEHILYIENKIVNELIITFLN
jgi:hypothetical protein